MNRAWREGVTSAWLGFALSALFFYPLASTLDSSIYFLHWQRRDMVETLLALAILASAFGLAVHVISRRPGRGATVGLCFVAALPLTSFVAGVSASFRCSPPASSRRGKVQPSGSAYPRWWPY